MLVQHIENLLPEHDCVVVPGLGGFVQNEIQAKINKDTDLFYPITKELFFNAKLKFNDGLLAQSYQENYGMSFEEANQDIRVAVQEITDKLNQGKFIRLGRIGTMSLNENQIVFRPDHKNLFFPDAYGLTPYTFPRMKVEKAEVQMDKHRLRNERKEKRKQDKKQEQRPPKDEFIHIRLRRNRLHQIVTGAAACLFMMLLSKPAGNISSAGSQEASMMHNYLSVATTPNFKPMPSESDAEVTQANTYIVKDVATSLPATVESTTVRSIAKIMAYRQKTPAVAEYVHAKDSNSSYYYVVIGTFSKRETAEIWLSEHQEDSTLQHSGIVDENGWARVYTQKFTDKQAAQAFLNQFTVDKPEYATAWLYSGKND
jgi:hypothetical protein